MEPNKTTLERAFELARSGHYSTVEAIRQKLRTEGYDQNQLAGRTLYKQLNQLVHKACAQDVRSSEF